MFPTTARQGTKMKHWL